MEAKTINRFEKAVKDINGRKVYRWQLHAKKASDSWLRKSITGDYCKLGKDWRKHRCCCSCSHTAFPGICSWLLSEAGHGTGWPSRSTPTFLPSPQKSRAEKSILKRAELKSKLAQPQPPNPQLRARCKLWLSTALRQRHSLWIWCALQKSTLLWMEAGWTQAYLHPVRQTKPLLSFLWQTPWTHRTIPSVRCLLSSSSLTSSLLNPGDHNCVLRDTRQCLKHDAWNCHLPTPLSTREWSNLESRLPFLRAATAHVADWNQGLMAWTGTTFSTELREPRAVTMASSVWTANSASGRGAMNHAGVKKTLLQLLFFV